MPLQIGDSSSEGWAGVKDIRVGGIAVNSVAMPKGKSWLELWRRDPHVIEIDSSTTLLSPSWALYVDVVIIGGGGGGAAGDGAVSNHGYGGNSGGYKSATRIVQPGQGLEFTIGLGGAGSKTEKGPGSIGGTTTFTHMDYSLDVTGGPGGRGTGTTANATGGDAWEYKLDGWNIMGAKGGAIDKPGQAPGAGGGGGSGGIFGRWSPGQAGGKGGAWVRFRSA